MLSTRVQHIERRVHQRKAEPLLRYLNPVDFARQRLGFIPDAWQEQVLQSQSKRIIMNACRQSGKSTTTAILALHRALYYPRSLILLVSPSLRQSAELFKKIQDFLTVLPVRPKLEEDNKLSLQLANGSRVVSLPGSEGTIRGFSGASLIVEDEASRVSDDLYLAVRPMLAVSNGRLILLSTPWGKRGHYYETWEKDDPSWQRIHITAYDCPRISPEFLAEEKADMPKAWFEAEYLGIFSDTVDSVFSYADVMGAITAEVTPLFVVPPLPPGVIDRKVSVLSFGGTH